MKILPITLTALLLVPAVLTGCSNDASQVYTEQTAEFDPALQPVLAESAAPKPTNDTPAMPKSSSDTPEPADDTPAVPEKVTLSDDQWKAILSDAEYYVLRQSGTEYAGTGRYLNNDAKQKGAYHCVGCGNKLYDASHKFHSGCGWPSFFKETEPGAIVTLVDKSIFPYRLEMRCARCDGHLGHIFDDAPDQPTGLRHCVNGTALIFVPQGKATDDVIREHRKLYADK